MPQSKKLDLRRLDPIRIEIHGSPASESATLAQLVEVWVNSPYFGRTPACNKSPIEVVFYLRKCDETESLGVRNSRKRYKIGLPASISNAPNKFGVRNERLASSIKTPLVDRFIGSSFSNRHDLFDLYSLFDKYEGGRHVLICNSADFEGSLTSLIFLILHLRELHIVGVVTDTALAIGDSKHLSVSESIQVLLPSVRGWSYRQQIIATPETSVQIPMDLWAVVQGCLPELDNLVPSQSFNDHSQFDTSSYDGSSVVVTGYSLYRFSKSLQRVMGSLFKFAESRLPLRVTQYLGEVFQLLNGRTRRSRNASFHTLPALDWRNWSRINRRLAISEQEKLPSEH